MIRVDHDQLVAPALAELPQLLDALPARRVLLVLDRTAARASGAEGPLLDMLAPRLAGVFDAFTPNPTSTQALGAARVAIEHGADGVVAFGGGSALDVGKVGALAAGAPDRAAELARGGASGGVAPLRVIAIPTTSGTGSDATHFAAIYVDGCKVSVAHPAIRPQAIVLDAELHMAMPRFVAATTGLDALCQATESMWAVAATPESCEHARAAQAGILTHLASSVLTGAREHREAMMHAAHRAGHAINISKTTAAHALSYQLTTCFGIAHGLAVALTLGQVARFNAGADHARRRVVEACLGCGAAPEDMPARLRELLATLGLPTTLSAAGVTRESLVPMAEAADAVRLSNNPRRLTTLDALAILESAF